LSKKYVNECYKETINNIRAYASEKKIWVSIDETTDVAGRYVQWRAQGGMMRDISPPMGFFFF